MNAAATGKLYMLLLVLQISIAGASAQPPPPIRTLIRAGHILEVKTGAEPAAQASIVAGDRIAAIAATASTPKQVGDNEIDLSGCTRMPGLIDVHRHLTAANNFDPLFQLAMTAAKEAILGVENAKVTIEPASPRSATWEPVTPPMSASLACRRWQRFRPVRSTLPT
jgi:hypothetical protein